MSLVISRISGLTSAWLLCSIALVHAQEAPRQMHYGTEDGFGLFQKSCMTCHGSPTQKKGARDPYAIRLMTPEAIYKSMVDGKMKSEAGKLSDEEKRLIAEFMSNRPIGSAPAGDARSMPNVCTSNPALADPGAAPAWNGWGADISQARFQPAEAAGLTADQVPHLKLKWAFAVPKGVNASGQPTIASGRVFVGSDTGYVYSLDAKTGCVYWSFETKVMVRNAISIGPLKGHGSTRYGIYFGDAHANVYGVDAQTGKQLWKTRVDNHYGSRITAAPVLYDSRLYVPVSNSEEYAAAAMHVECCTARGAVVALDANTGKQIWKTYVVDEPKPTKKNSQGTQLYAPAGGAVWNTPSLDPKLRAVYFGTGDAETEPASKNSDAIMAVDMDSGKVRWVYQVIENDSFLVGCGPSSKSENCPSKNGPDSDIGASPILRTLANGKRVIVGGAKEGSIFALDPDDKGKVLWRVKGTRTGVFFGGSADEQNVYYGFSGGGAAAYQMATGERLWFNPLSTPGQRVSTYAATTTIPGVVFVSGSDGKVHALSTKDGNQIWEYDTAQEFTTVNKVPGKGGSLRAPGPTVAGGMLFIRSGYAVTGGDKPGNVLLAFGAE